MRRFISKNSGVKHIKYVDERPLSISEMYRRSILGIPLSCSRPKENNIPINNRFYTDDFDVLDIAIQNDMRIHEENKRQLLEKNAQYKKDQEEFKVWKELKQKEILERNNIE